MVYDRVHKEAHTQLGNATSTGSNKAEVFQIIVVISLVVFLFGMLIYLIYLRRARI